jgi:hypothetical protein
MRQKASLRLAGVLVLALAVAGIATASAAAATISGSIKNGKGYQVLLVQSDGTTKKARISSAAGAFSIRGASLGNASLQLVRRDGSYYGPVVLKATADKAYVFVARSAGLKLGGIVLKSGYALVKVAPAGRYQKVATASAKAVRGKPIGAGRLGLVATAEPGGLNGPGADLDRDGVINAFDIDDNGNRILDNVDRTGRGAARPSVVNARSARLTGPSLPRAAGGPPPANEFRMFSNFKLGGATSINVNIPGISNVDALIAQYVPSTVTLATQVMGGSRATLDGLGNTYVQPHSLDGVTYPLMNFVAATYTGGLLDLEVGPSNDAQIKPGALPAEIGAGDSFVETTADGTSYPGTLNFVFDTAPALASYRFDTDQDPTAVTYDANGASAQGMTPGTRLVVPIGATAVTLTLWRPQRQTTAGESGNEDGWVDIGGLDYQVDIPNAPITPDGAGQPSTHNAQGSYSNASANGVPVTPSMGGVLDPALDAASSTADTITFTVSLTTCFSGWSSFGSGTQFDFDVAAISAYGDNAARKLYFVTQ